MATLAWASLAALGVFCENCIIGGLDNPFKSSRNWGKTIILDNDQTQNFRTQMQKSPNFNCSRQDPDNENYIFYDRNKKGRGIIMKLQKCC